MQDRKKIERKQIRKLRNIKMLELNLAITKILLNINTPINKQRLSDCIKIIM